MISELQNLLTERLEGMGRSDVVPTVTVSDDPSHGDYATNVAFTLAKKLGTNPMDAASRLANSLAEDMPPILAKVEVAHPGFLNLTLSPEFLISQMQARVLSTELKPLSASFAHKRVMIEFTDPNPFKEFHIGHLYSNIVGESISRLLETAGAEVKRVCYQGDVGLHVAKSVWGMQEKFRIQHPEFSIEDANKYLEELDRKPLQEKAKFLGEAYALGATKFEDDEKANAEIIVLNKVIYEKSDPKVLELYTKGRQWSLDYFETIYARLGTKFWRYYFESEAGPIGVDLVKEYLGKGVFKESEGAIVFPGEEYGLHTRVFINSQGLPTYEAKELGLAPTKYKDYPYDQSIIITGNEVNEYFKVLIKALSVVHPDLGSKTKHISHGIVRLPEGKMSSRTGRVLTGEWLLNEAVSRAKDKIAESRAQRAESKELENPEEVAEMVGVGAVKWALLRTGIGKDIEFSFDESVSFDGNSGPYLQYTYVRTRSVLQKAGISNFKFQISNKPIGNLRLDIGNGKFSSEERKLLVYLTRYNDIIVEAAERYSPNIVAIYLFELAQLFNNFYQKHPILKPQRGDSSPDNPLRGVSPEDEESIRHFRLVLTQAVGTTIKNGLNLLGIQTPERM